MDPSNNASNQGYYWFVLREDQGNVISTNSISTAAPNTQTSAPESRYVVDGGPPDRVYTECAPAPAASGAPPAPWGSTGSVEDAPRARKDDFWDHGKVKLLLTLCLENKGVEKDIPWEDIGRVLGAPPAQCSAKYRHLRRTYLRLLRKKRLGGKEVKWAHYAACEEVFTSLGALPATALDLWDDARVRALLTLYIEYLPRFRSPNGLQKDLWKEIATRLGTTGYSCYHKFKNLKRSYFNWLSRSRQTGKGIKWPYHHYFERIYYNHSPNSDTKPWERAKIKQLLEVYAQMAHKFRNPKLQKKELWKEVSNKVGETPAMCDKKFRNLKQTYMRLKGKTASGHTTKWRYYRDFELIYANTMRYIDMDGAHIVYRESMADDYVRHLLKFYIENKSKFRDPLTKNKTLWRMIGPRLGLTAEECDKKFRNLKQTYIRLVWKKKQTGKCSKWPYFSQFEHIYNLRTEACGKTDEPREPQPEPARTPSEADGHTARRRRDRDRRFHALAAAAEQSNCIQRERNRILLALLQSRK